MHIQNEKPVKLWRMLDATFLVGVSVLPLVALLMTQFFHRRLEIYWAIVVILIGLWSGAWVFLRREYRRRFPLYVDIQDDRFMFTFEGGRTLPLSFRELSKVELIGPGKPSAFGLVQALLYRKDWNIERIEIYGDAAKSVKEHFDVFQSKSTVIW